MTKRNRHNSSYYNRMVINCTVGGVILGFLIFSLFVNNQTELISPLVKGPQLVEASDITPTPKVIFRRLETPRDFAMEWAYIYGVNPELMFCLIKNESGWRSEARPRGKDGQLLSSAYGFGQFIDGTWKQWRKQMGEDPDPELRTNANAATQTMAWALSKGYRSHWEADHKHCANIPTENK